MARLRDMCYTKPILRVVVVVVVDFVVQAPALVPHSMTLSALKRAKAIQLSEKFCFYKRPSVITALTLDSSHSFHFFFSRIDYGPQNQ